MSDTKIESSVDFSKVAYPKFCSSKAVLLPHGVVLMKQCLDKKSQKQFVKNCEYMSQRGGNQDLRKYNQNLITGAFPVFYYDWPGPVDIDYSKIQRPKEILQFTKDIFNTAFEYAQSMKTEFNPIPGDTINDKTGNNNTSKSDTTGNNTPDKLNTNFDKSNTSTSDNNSDDKAKPDISKSPTNIPTPDITLNDTNGWDPSAIYGIIYPLHGEFGAHLDGAKTSTLAISIGHSAIFFFDGPNGDGREFVRLDSGDCILFNGGTLYHGVKEIINHTAPDWWYKTLFSNYGARLNVQFRDLRIMKNNYKPFFGVKYT